MLVAMLLCGSQSMAAPITDVTPLHKARGSVSYEHSFFQGRYHFEGLRIGKAEIENQQININAQFGVFKNFELRLIVPVVIAQTTELSGLGQATVIIPSPPIATPVPAPDGKLDASGLGDIGLGVRYAILTPQSFEDLNFTWVLEAIFFIPTGGDSIATLTSDGDVGYGALHYRLGTAFSRVLGGFEPYLGAYYLLYSASDTRVEDRGDEWEIVSGFLYDLLHKPERQIRFRLDTGVSLKLTDKGTGDLLRQVVGAPHYQSLAEFNTKTDRYVTLGGWFGFLYQINPYLIIGVHGRANYITEHTEDIRHNIQIEETFQVAGTGSVEFRY